MMVSKHIIAVVIIIAFFLLIPVSKSFAYVSVNGHYRSSGTYVQPYVRSEPNGLRYDNYGYDGGSLYNSSYYYPDYSSDWYTPSWNSDPDYYYGRSLYNSYNNYDYNDYNDYWDW